MVSDKGQPASLVRADTIVLAMGVEPVNELANELTGKVDELYTVGNAKQPGRIREATSDGYVVACNL